MLTPGRKASTISDIFIAQPDVIKESLAGKLFILFEIESRKVDSLKVINFLIDNINYNYYQSEKIILREKITSLKVEHIFETALAKTNKNFNEFLNNEKIKINLRSINITVGIIHENILYFANTGKNKVFLIYKSNPKQGKNLTNQSEKNMLREDKSLPKGEYKITDITQQTTVSDYKKEDEMKLFSNVISGPIPHQGHFVIANEALPEYITNKQLIQIVTTLPPASAVEQIKNILSKINAYVSFLGIIIKSTTLEKTEKQKKIAPLTTHESVLDLNITEETTEHLLTPSGLINFKKWYKFPQLFVKQRKEIKSDRKRLTLLKDKIFFKKQSFAIIKKIINIIKNIAISLLNIFFYLTKALSSRKNIIRLFSRIKINFAKQKEKFLFAFNNLNNKSKILLILSLSFLLIFAVNLSIIKLKNKKVEEQKSYTDLTALIERKQNQAEANLLYSNEEGARKLFTEIEKILAGFPQDTEEQKEQLRQFHEKFKLQLEKIRRVTRIDQPTELANFINLNSQAKPENIVLGSSAKKIYSADSSQKSIYILDITNNLITTLTDLEQTIIGLRLPAKGINNSIYYFNDTNIIEFNTEKEAMNSLAINIIGNHYDFVSADTYNNKLYMLNAKDSQIYRYNKVGQGFSPSPYSWLKEKINLETAVDMSIDGHIYILKNNGEIIKLLRGKTVDLALEQIDPPLTKPTKLFVSPELKFIYVLEPMGKRLAVFDKTGQFIMQYYSDQLTDLKDFVVDEKNKILYFLNATVVFSFNCVHFEE